MPQLVQQICLAETLNDKSYETYRPMSKGVSRNTGTRAATRERVRGSDGQFLPEGEERKPQTQERRRRRTERDYLARVVDTIGTREIQEVVQSIVQDATEGEPKVRTAAREWIGKYCLGNGRVPLTDIDAPPAIVRRR